MNYVYLLRCADGSLYCGWTTDPDARAAAHNSGRGAKYTRSRLPVSIVYLEAYENRHEAGMAHQTDEPGRKGKTDRE